MPLTCWCATLNGQEEVPTQRMLTKLEILRVLDALLYGGLVRSTGLAIIRFGIKKVVLRSKVGFSPDLESTRMWSGKPQNNRPSASVTRARTPRWESGTGERPRPRQIGDGDGGESPIPDKSGTGTGERPRPRANRGRTPRPRPRANRGRGRGRGPGCPRPAAKVQS
jgi:hypothetical protein